MSLSLDLGCLKQLNCYSRTPNAKSRLHPVSYTWKNLASCYSKCLEFTIESCNFFLVVFYSLSLFVTYCLPFSSFSLYLVSLTSLSLWSCNGVTMVVWVIWWRHCGLWIVGGSCAGTVVVVCVVYFGGSCDGGVGL